MWDPERALDWSPGWVTTTTSIDVAQVRKDALDEVIVYFEGEIKKLVAKMVHSGEEADTEGNHPDDYYKARCWHLTRHDRPGSHWRSRHRTGTRSKPSSAVGAPGRSVARKRIRPDCPRATARRFTIRSPGNVTESTAGLGHHRRCFPRRRHRSPPRYSCNGD